MSRETADLLSPRILVVDDERQIHASLRLRLAKNHELVCCFSGREALAVLATQQFDLCLVDIHMPQMDGLTFIAAAQKADPNLGFVILSAFDSDENLRRTIPLQVFDFIAKPLPERDGFEARLPEWIERTRQQRRTHSLAQQAGAMEQDLDSARLEREVELVASETARDALLQTANLLTTIHAHLVTGTVALGPRARTDAGMNHLLRNLDEARKTAEAAISVAESFFDSGYGNRDASPALVNSGLRHALSIATRMSRAEQAGKTVDLSALDDRLPIRGLTGIDFLLMMVPVIGIALTVSPPNATVRIDGETLGRIEVLVRDAALRNYLWVNRKHAVISQPGVLVTVAAHAPALSRAQAEGWLKGEHTPFAAISARGLVLGIQKCHALLGIAISPPAGDFRLVVALPT